MVFVTTTCVMDDLEIFSIAGGENTGCEAARIHRGRSVLDQRARRLHQCSRRINQIVDDQAVPSAYIADDVHHFRHVHFDSPFIDDRQRRIHLLREKSRALHATRVRRNHGQVRQIQFPEMI